MPWSLTPGSMPKCFAKLLQSVSLAMLLDDSLVLDSTPAAFIRDNPLFSLSLSSSALAFLLNSGLFTCHAAALVIDIGVPMFGCSVSLFGTNGSTCGSRESPSCVIAIPFFFKDCNSSAPR
jgi:hypothetical protein